MKTYIFKCGHRSTETTIIKDKRDNNRHTCPECGAYVQNIEITCSICRQKVLLSPGGIPSPKCKKHRHLMTVKEVAEKLGVSRATINTYVWKGKIKAQKIKAQNCLTKNQFKNLQDKSSPRKKINTKPHCNKYNCRYRSDCLLTDKIYQTNCPDYKPEYEAGDFYGRVAMDQYDRFVEKG